MGVALCLRGLKNYGELRGAYPNTMASFRFENCGELSGLGQTEDMLPLRPF